MERRETVLMPPWEQGSSMSLILIDQQAIQRRNITVCLNTGKVSDAAHISQHSLPMRYKALRDQVALLLLSEELHFI